MRKVTVLRMHERYEETVLTFRITCIQVGTFRDSSLLNLYMQKVL